MNLRFIIWKHALPVPFRCKIVLSQVKRLRERIQMAVKEKAGSEFEVSVATLEAEDKATLATN